MLGSEGLTLTAHFKSKIQKAEMGYLRKIKGVIRIYNHNKYWKQQFDMVWTTSAHEPVKQVCESTAEKKRHTT